MTESKYFLIFFDFEDDISGEGKIVKATIDELHTVYYKNRSLKISWNVLLIKPLKTDFSSPQSTVDSTFCEQVKKHNFYFHEGINFFTLPVDIETISYYANKFKKELDYIDSKDVE